ncbi:MAG: hypothetical protein FH762_01225 [Firmicutes bacterium]|nr:hypothetical protein [Bacillota bacterium]
MKHKNNYFYIVLLIIFTLFISSLCMAISLDNIIKAHEESLRLYRAGNVRGAIKVLEDNKVQDIIDFRPNSISEGTYVLILNNYGFYLSKTEDRYQEAVPILERVIEISPKRSVAYLNIGDVYNKMYHQEQKCKQKEILKERIKGYYNKYLSLLKMDANIPYRVKKFLRDEAFEKAMEEIRKSEYEIRERSEAKNYPDDFFEKFLEDFKAGKNMGFIEPILVTDDINNKKLRQYFKNDTEFIEEIITVEETGGISPTRKYRSEFNYKLYYLDFDNNPENGKEYLFYSGGYMDIWGGGMQSNWDDYYMIDFEEKKITGVVSVHNTIDYKTKKRTNNFNGVIKYKGRYFIYEIREMNYSIVLYAWNNNANYIPVLVRFYLEREADN